MAWAKDTQIKAWSFSRYSTYKQCPLKAKLLYIDKLKEPGSPAMDRGSAIHKLAENYMKGTIGKLPAELKLFGTFMKKMKALFKKAPDTITVEETWAHRRDWTRTTWDDWNGCWLRVKLDVAHVEDNTVYVTDFKTGKFSPQYNLADYVEQLDLYATAALVVYADRGPSLRIVPRLLYLDHDITYPSVGEEKFYTPADLPRLKKEWEKRTKPMLSDKQFAPKPNQFCRSCHFRKDNKANGGGQCKY
jgi:RecB family exonuclease